MTKKIVVLKDFTYFSMIKEAIYSTESMKATASEIFNYFTLRFPNIFTHSNSMTWKGNIRQVLSKNPEFIKMYKLGKLKEHYWTHRPIELLEANRSNNNSSSNTSISDKVNLIKNIIKIKKYPNYLKERDCNRTGNKNGFKSNLKLNEIENEFEIVNEYGERYKYKLDITESIKDKIDFDVEFDMNFDNFY
jgi:hypothetical protein